MPKKIITAPRKIVTPRPKLPGTVPEGMTKVEFYNSAANLKNLAQENGLFRTPENFLMFRKLIGHSSEFDAAVILDTSSKLLNPLGRPVRRTQLNRRQKKVWTQMSEILFRYMLDTYPDPEKHLVLCGEASLDATWPLTRHGVPSIRMIHNHFMVFPMDQLAKAPHADPMNPNLTDAGHNTMLLRQLIDVYVQFLDVLDLQVLTPLEPGDGALSITGYPKGLPAWELKGGADQLKDRYFWYEYEQILKAFLDFYRTFFLVVASGEELVPKTAYFRSQIRDVLLSDPSFLRAARELRERVIADPQFANDIRWLPAYKQLLYRDERGRLLVTISQNSVGNAITELLGIVVERRTMPDAFDKIEPKLVGRLLEARERLIAANIGEPLSTPCWPDGQFIPGCRGAL